MSDPAPNESGKRLRDSLNSIYREFEMRAPSVIEGCPCCISTRGTDVLLTTPLRQITGQELWRYVSGAFLTVGNEFDFRYLLPRILELSVTDPGNSNDPEIVLGKLALANWRSWTLDEQRAIEEFVDAWFEHALETDLANAEDGWIGYATESVLCGAARAKMPLARWLLRLHDPSASPVLADMRERFPREMSAFWEDVPLGFQEFSTILAQGNA